MRQVLIKIKIDSMKQTVEAVNKRLQELPTELVRTLPANIKAEQMLLGAILINNEHLNKVREFLLPQHFYNLLHQKIYRSIEIVVDKGVIANHITLKNMFTDDEVFVQAGGVDYLGQLTTMAITTINPRDYGKIIHDLALKRYLIEIGEEIVNTSYDPNITSDSREQIEQAEAKLYNLAADGSVEKGFVKIGDVVEQSVNIINRAMKNSENVIGISSGLDKLDKVLSGFHNSDLVILAGRPSMGKTAFAINFALNACKALITRHEKFGNGEERPPTVGFFSLEMSAEQLGTRLLSIMSGIQSQALRTGNLKESEYNKLRKAHEETLDLRFYIDDTPALSISAIRTKARNLKRKHNLGILFIDYLQLIKGVSNKENRVMEVSEITQGLKAIAKELNIPIIALAQLSRAVESRVDKKPMLSDLRESGSIEQDADVVMFLYREEYYLSRSAPLPGSDEYDKWQEKINKVHNITEILVAKHRNGPIGNVPVEYYTDYSKVTNLPPEREMELAQANRKSDNETKWQSK